MQAPDPVARRLGAAGDIQLLTFLLAMALPVRPSVGSYPLSTMAAALLVGLAVFRPRREGHFPRIVTMSLLGLVVWLLGLSILSGTPDVRRMGNVAIISALTWALAQGRLHVPSVVWGAGAGLGLGVLHAGATLGASSYAGRITGYIGDPNGVGFTVSAMGLVLIGMAVRRRQVAFLLWLLVGGALLLTVSRTSIFAYLMATLWALTSPKIGRIPSVGLLAAGVPLFAWASRVVERRGTFAERDGSDELRETLVQLEEQQISGVGWVGRGLGDTRVVLDGQTFWFHNSFFAARVEGGRLFYVLLGVAILGLILAAFAIAPSRRNPWFEASLIAILICSVNVGYSLISVVTAFCLGVFLNYWRENHADAEEALPEANRRISGVAGASSKSRVAG